MAPRTPHSFSHLAGSLAFAALTVAMPVTAQKPESPAMAQSAAFYSDAAWRDFLAEDGGSWTVEWCAATGTPRAIWGSGMPLRDWRKNSLEEARRHAVQLLQERDALLRLGTSEFREVIGARMSRTWVFVFDQFFRGLPVIGGRADVRVHMVGRVSMFGSTAWQVPATFDTTPNFDGDTALAMAWQALGQSPTGVKQPAAVAAPRLVIWGDVTSTEPGTFHLAWEVAVSNVDQNGAGPIGRYYVDARTGAVLRYENDKHECGLALCPHKAGAPTAAAAAAAAPAALPVLTTVTVMAWTRTGLDAFSALTNAPLPGLVLNVPGLGTRTTDANGQFTIDITAPVTITVGQLDGRHFNPIVDLGPDAPSASVVVNPGVNATIQLLTAGATTNQAAHTTTAYWVDKTNEWARSILGNSSQMSTISNIEPEVNIAQTCNAFYTGNTINFYIAGGCANTAFSTVIAHEWGHGLDDRYGGISQIDGLSEAWGDIAGLYLVDDPGLGSGFSTAGVPLRNGNNTQQFPAPGGVHTQGQTFMGFAWKLRDRLATTLGNRPAAITLSNDIVLGTIVADSIDQTDAVLQVFLADDDDGNLTNQTPHWADLVWACNQHSLPVPGAPSNLPNDLCTDAIALVNGVNGPFTSTGATTSAPAWACASGGKDVWFTYTTPTNGTLFVETCNLATWDTAIEIFSGSCAALTSIGCNDDSCTLQSSLSVPVTPGTYYVRVGGYNSASGPFSLNVNGPGGILAASSTFGAGCYRQSTAFYELFANTALDLSGSSMRLVRNGNSYTAQPGGTYVAPSGTAQQLSLVDDSFATVALGGTLTYPGGTTTSLEICSNGFVSVAPGNPANYLPVAAEWLGSVQRRWGTWHDFNPNASGSGKVKFEKVGTIAYVTWQGVYSYGTTDANTWQLQFDLTTGNVTYVWQTMVATGNGWLVGLAGTTPNNDLGSMDISASLPATFQVGPNNAVPLAHASTLPQLGTTLVLTTSDFPASSLLGLQILSLTRFDPGIDLVIIDMPGCFLFANPDLLDVLIPISGQATYNWAIANDPTMMGLAVTAQATAFVTGLNPFGMTSSNGVALTLGL